MSPAACVWSSPSAYCCKPWATRSHPKAVEMIRSEAGQNFEPVLVEAFLRCHEQFDQARALHPDRAQAPEPVMA